MNEVDADRLKARMRNQAVVDLDAYRAAAASTAKTSQTYLDGGTKNWIFFAVFIVFLFIALRISV